MKKYEPLDLCRRLLPLRWSLCVCCKGKVSSTEIVQKRCYWMSSKLWRSVMEYTKTKPSPPLTHWSFMHANSSCLLSPKQSEETQHKVKQINVEFSPGSVLRNLLSVEKRNSKQQKDERKKWSEAKRRRQKEKNMEERNRMKPEYPTFGRPHPQPLVFWNCLLFVRWAKWQQKNEQETNKRDKESYFTLKINGDARIVNW